MFLSIFKLCKLSLKNDKKSYMNEYQIPQMFCYSHWLVLIVVQSASKPGQPVCIHHPCSLVIFWLLKHKVYFRFQQSSCLSCAQGHFLSHKKCFSFWKGIFVLASIFYISLSTKILNMRANKNIGNIHMGDST